MPKLLAYLLTFALLSRYSALAAPASPAEQAQPAPLIRSPDPCGPITQTDDSTTRVLNSCNQPIFPHNPENPPFYSRYCMTYPGITYPAISKNGCQPAIDELCHKLDDPSVATGVWHQASNGLCVAAMYLPPMLGAAIIPNSQQCSQQVLQTLGQYCIQEVAKIGPPNSGGHVNLIYEPGADATDGLPTQPDGKAFNAGYPSYVLRPWLGPSDKFFKAPTDLQSVLLNLLASSPS